MIKHGHHSKNAITKMRYTCACSRNGHRCTTLFMNRRRKATLMAFADNGPIKLSVLKGDPSVLRHAAPSGSDDQDYPLDSTWLDIETAARYLHISKSSLYNLIREEKIPTVYVGRLRRINRKELDSILESGGLVL